MSFEDFTSFLSEKAKEASNLYKTLFLKITGIEFKKQMSSLIHKLQKQISKHDREASIKKNFEIASGRSGRSWNECLADLSDWAPTDKNGNITIDHFERCKSFFLSLKISQHEFARAQELLDYLNVVEKKKRTRTTSVAIFHGVDGNPLERELVENITQFQVRIG